jgi:RluA family pseudouridine synthase
VEGALEQAAGQHYASAPPSPAGATARRLISAAHLGRTGCDVDIEPAAVTGGWEFRVSNHNANLEMAAEAVRAALGTDPELSPIERSIQLAADTVQLHPNQRALLDNLDQYVVYEDDNVLALNKPPYVSTNWDAAHHVGATEIVKAVRGDAVERAHRLDRATSGVLLFGKDEQSWAHLKAQFARKTEGHLRKLYVATVRGEFPFPQSVRCFLREGKRGKMVASADPDAGKFARTTFTPLAEIESVAGERQTVLGVEIFTGRTHQIRASLHAIGHPILNDPLYPQRQPRPGRMRLHAHDLTFTHPASGQAHRVTAPLPQDFSADLDDANRTSAAGAVAQWLAGQQTPQ